MLQRSMVLASCWTQHPKGRTQAGVGVESFGYGDRMSPAAEASLPGLADAVAELIADHSAASLSSRCGRRSRGSPRTAGWPTPRWRPRRSDVELRCGCGFGGALGHDDLIGGSVAVCPACGEVSTLRRTGRARTARGADGLLRLPSREVGNLAAKPIPTANGRQPRRPTSATRAERPPRSCGRSSAGRRYVRQAARMRERLHDRCLEGDDLVRDASIDPCAFCA